MHKKKTLLMKYDNLEEQEEMDLENDISNDLIMH